VPGNEKVDQLAKEATGFKGSPRGNTTVMIPKLKASYKRILKRVCHEKWTLLRKPLAEAREGYLASYPPVEKRHLSAPTLAFAIVEGPRDILSRDRLVVIL
jgi:hypothetical protein